MMLMDADSKLDAWILEQLDGQFTCGVPFIDPAYPECKEIAAWVLEFQCCERTFLLCQQHFTAWNASIARDRKSGARFHCSFCGKHNIDFGGAFRWFPMGDHR